MIGLNFRDQLPTGPVVDEFEQLVAKLKAYLLVEHNEDGTHNVRPSGFDFVPIGTMAMWGNVAAPDGWKLCNGDVVSRVTYQALFNVLGTTYGAGDGSTTFGLPDLRQRFPLGLAAAGTGSTLGATGGAIDHTHTGPSHTHTLPATTDAGGDHDHSGVTGSTAPFTDSDSLTPATTTVVPAGTTVVALGFGHVHSHQVDSHTHAISASGTHTHALSGATGSSGTGATGTNNPPYTVVNFIICVGV